MKRDVPQRFWSKVAIGEPDECWLWTKSRFPKGYGQFRVRPAPASPQKASRVAWALSNRRPVPDGLFVCHRCDNPPCCNPNHLFLGTGRDNMRDCIEKGRAGVCSPEFVAGLVERQRRLSDDQLRKAVLRNAGGESCRSIARDMGVAHTTITRLINGEQWAGWPLTL